MKGHLCKCHNDSTLVHGILKTNENIHAHQRINPLDFMTSLLMVQSSWSDKIMLSHQKSYKATNQHTQNTVSKKDNNYAQQRIH